MTIGALVHGGVPTGLLQSILGPANPLAVLLAAVVGAPIYVSFSGTLPIGPSFSQTGIPIGTLIAFVMGSAGMSLPNLVLLNKLFRRRLLAAYATMVVFVAILVRVTFTAIPV